MSAPMSAIQSPRLSLNSLFVSHGAPSLILDDADPTVMFLRELGTRLPRPAAVVAVSAHWCTSAPKVSTAPHPVTIHDFSGFPAELYRRRYAAPGAPDVARRVAALLSAGGIPCGLDPDRGLDHGAWVPMSLLWPAADVPVFQLSVQPDRDAAHHFAVGSCLQGLAADGVLVLASGSATHNLRALDWGGGGAPRVWAAGFADWLSDRLEAGYTAALLDWSRQAPDAAMNHPTDEHLLPLFVALGAAGEGVTAAGLHRAYTYGSLAMDAYGFGHGYPCHPLPTDTRRDGLA